MLKKKRFYRTNIIDNCLTYIKKNVKNHEMG